MFQKTGQSKRPKHFKQYITIPEGTVSKEEAPLKEEVLPAQEAPLEEEVLPKEELSPQEDVLPAEDVALRAEKPLEGEKLVSPLEEQPSTGEAHPVPEEALLEQSDPAPHEVPGLRDLHTHVVYGVDDGAQTQADMHAMLDQAVANGVTVIYATSHHTPGVEHFPQETYVAHLQEARDYCAAKGYSLTLYPGAEILYTPALHNYIERRPLPTLGNSRCILMEFVPDVSPAEAEEAISLVEDHGYTPILAHIERYEKLSAQRLRKIKQQHNVLYQVNCGTIVKGKGFFKTRALRSLLQGELIDFISSDMHNTHNRPNRMRECWDKLSAQYPQDYVSRIMTNEQSL